MERDGRCPVTGGLATRMSGAGFKELCGRKRKNRAGFIRIKCTRGEEREPFSGFEYRRCAWCGGKRENWPGELAVIDIKLEEPAMGKKTGVCDICGERKELKHAARGGGLDVCTSCFGLLTAAGKPELLAKAVRLADAEGALSKALSGSAEGNAPETDGASREAAASAEAAALGGYISAAVRSLAAVLPFEDEGLDDTRSYADIMDLAERAATRMTADAAELHTLGDMLKPAEDETLIRAATRMVPAARAWNALMDRARDVGFADIAEADPVVMAGTYIMAVDEVMRERDKLKAELAAETPTSEETARNAALLRWAREQLEAGRIGFHIEVREVAA